jgi:hypothetical protein
VSKILNLSPAGVLVDQIEELDPGDAGERVFDTLLGRLSDPRAPASCWRSRTRPGWSPGNTGG